MKHHIFFSTNTIKLMFLASVLTPTAIYSQSKAASTPQKLILSNFSCKWAYSREN